MFELHVSGERKSVAADTEAGYRTTVLCGLNVSQYQKNRGHSSQKVILVWLQQHLINCVSFCQIKIGFLGPLCYELHSY